MNGERGRILIVDDNENMRRLLGDILAPKHDVVLAGDGAAARAHLEESEFDVVLTDVRMPGLDGFELAKLLKERWPLTEIVVMTAYASIPSAVEAMRRGAAPEEAALEAVRRIASRTRLPRLLDAKGRPRFDVKVYCLRRDGAHGAASIWSGGQYAVRDGAEARLLPAAFLHERE